MAALESDELRKRGVKAVIALGRSGLKAAANLDKQFAVVAGGVLSEPDAEAQSMLVQSLAPEPALLFNKRKAFARWCGAPPARHRLVGQCLQYLP